MMLTSTQKEDFLIRQLEYSFSDEEVILHFQWPKEMKSILLYEYPISDRQTFRWDTQKNKKVAKNEYVSAGGCVRFVPQLKGKIGITILPVLERAGKEAVVLQNNSENEIALIAQPLLIHVTITELNCLAKQLMKRSKRIELKIVPDFDHAMYIPAGTLEVQYSQGTWCIQEEIDSEGFVRVLEEPVNSKLNVQVSQKTAKRMGGEQYEIQLVRK